MKLECCGGRLKLAIILEWLQSDLIIHKYRIETKDSPFDTRRQMLRRIAVQIRDRHRP